MKPLILLIDDDSGTIFGFSKYLSKIGYEVISVPCLQDAKEQIFSQRFDAMLLDLNLPDGNGLDWIPTVRENYPDMPVIVITGMNDVPVAVEAMRRGADNFLTKPVDMASLEVFLKKTIELGSIRRKHFTELRLARTQEICFGKSIMQRKVKELSLMAARNNAPLLITGETGIGKGLLAKWIHNNSKRSSQPFVEINCSGLRGELLASELFGNIRGAFTTAVQDRQGLIEVADRGTLFLDEIGDMDITIQSSFLKVIEEKTFRKIGDTRQRKSDFRLICATNKELEKEIKEGKFRMDLFFRIHIFPIQIPPLRETPEDVPALVRHIVKLVGYPDVAISEEVMHLLKVYSWPGNIRELRNILERALILSGGDVLAIEHFPGLNSSHYTLDYTGKTFINTDKVSKSLSTLKDFNGNVKKAAESLGISRATFYRRLKKGSE